MLKGLWPGSERADHCLFCKNLQEGLFYPITSNADLFLLQLNTNKMFSIKETEAHTKSCAEGHGRDPDETEVSKFLIWDGSFHSCSGCMEGAVTTTLAPN